MQISELMTSDVISVQPTETADVAARLLSRNNIGALPVCDGGGHLLGMVTDRDLVTRCIAAGQQPAKTPVALIMTGGVVSAREDETVEAVSARMGQQQVRRIPVTDGERLTGIVSLADLARAEQEEASDALTGISQNISRR